MRKTLLHLIVLSCRKASFLIEKEQGKPLSFIDKTQLKLHLKICSKCSNYQQQSNLINDVLKLNHKPDSAEFTLSEDAKNRLRQILIEKLKK